MKVLYKTLCYIVCDPEEILADGQVLAFEWHLVVRSRSMSGDQGRWRHNRP